MENDKVEIVNRSVSSQVNVGIGLWISAIRFRLPVCVPNSGALRVTRIPTLLTLAFALCVVTQVWSQEHEVPQVELLGGYSYLRSSDTNFNGWKASLVGNVKSWVGIAADFDGHYAGGESEHSITFGPEFCLRKSKKWTPVGYALFGVAFEKSESGETDHGFATELGGGLDYEISHRWTLRAFDVTASITHVGGETHVNPKVGFGVILNLGQK